MTLDGVLDPLYPHDPQHRCDRCDRGVDTMDERSVLELLCFPSVDASERIRNADRQVTLCLDCQRRLVPALEALSLTPTRTLEHRNEVPPGCDRCGAHSDYPDEIVIGYDGNIGPGHWAARLCPECAARLRRTVARVLAERAPYDGAWYRPPSLRRAEAGVETWKTADTPAVEATFATLQAGDLVRLVAYRPGYRSRGVYLGLTATVERALSPFSDGPPATVDLRAVEHELTVPGTPRDDSWTIQARDSGPTITYRDTRLDISELFVLHRRE